MSNMPSENLEERIERILRKNQEIEKKHREAEEDRLMALKDNAMVEIKAPKDEDWPREHKYDKLDFTYDQKPEIPEEELSEGSKESDSTTVPNNTKVKRDYKKFAEGEGPPPDPMYNFLADAERDGKAVMRGENNRQSNLDSTPNNHKKDWKQNQQKGKPTGGGRGGRHGKNGRSNDYDSWKNEREKIDEERISRQKAGEGKWRREWDNEKDNESSNKNNGNAQQKVNNSADLHVVQQPVNLANTFPSNQKSHASSIMVSVSQDANGEVKSVKLTSAPIIGTGRVGPRQITKPQFQVLNRPESNQIKKSIDGNRNDRPPPPQRSHSLRYDQTAKQPLIKSASIQDRLKPKICQNNNVGEPLIQSPHNPVFVNN